VKGSDLDKLAELASTGDPSSLERLLGELQQSGTIRAAISEILIDRYEVDEAEQEALISVARSIRSFRSESSCITWVWSIARRRAIDVLRRRRRDEHELATNDVDSQSDRISSMVAMRQSIADLIAELPDLYAEAVRMRDLELLSYQEVAEALGVNLNTARTRISRGRALLASRIESSAW